MNNKGLKISMTVTDDPLCPNYDENKKTQKGKILNIYDREIIDILLFTHKPFARMAADMLRRKDVSIVQGYRALANTIIELEEIKEDLEKELIDYKMRYGNIPT